MERLLHQHFRIAFRYNEWANERLYEHCTRLDEAAYRARSDSAGNLHDLLAARLAWDKIWFSRLQGYVADSTSAGADMHETFEPLRDAQLAHDVELSEYVHGLAEEDLLRPIAYDDEGTAHTNAQHELLTHLAAEQVACRARALERFAAAGAPAPDLAVLTFFRETYVGVRSIKS